MDTNNPNAFPELYVHSPEPGIYKTMAEGGMSLRDYFAAKAMNGAISAMNTGDGTFSFDDEHVAGIAYALADAMLKERAK